MESINNALDDIYPMVKRIVSRESLTIIAITALALVILGLACYFAYRQLQGRRITVGTNPLPPLPSPLQSAVPQIDAVAEVKKGETATAVTSVVRVNPPQPTKFVFVSKITALNDSSRVAKEIGTVQGAPTCECITEEAATEQKAALLKEMNEGTTILIGIYIIPSRMEVPVIKSSIEFLDLNFDQKKVVHMFIWKEGTTALEQSNLEDLFSTLLAKDSEGQKCVRYVNAFRKPGLYVAMKDPIKALVDTKKKADVLFSNPL